MGRQLSISFNKDIGANDKCFLFIFKVKKKKKPKLDVLAKKEMS